jgi:hypothetical protein
MKMNLYHMLGIEHLIIAAPMGPGLTGPSWTPRRATLARGGAADHPQRLVGLLEPE